jgi:hypothetical protein
VTESATLRERGGAAHREVDILVEHTVAGHTIRIAIECRDHTRLQTIEWIDSLVGKYADLPVDKIVAVTKAGFRPAAREKALQNRIDLMTAAAATEVDWAAQLVRPWKLMTHSNTLMLIAVFGMGGLEISKTTVDETGLIPSHRDQLSENLYEPLRQLFFSQLASTVEAQINAKIDERWADFIDDPRARYAEFTIPAASNASIEVHGQRHAVEKIVFGVGTLFHVVERMPDSIVMQQRLIQSLSHNVGHIPVEVHWVVNSDGQLQYLKVGAS